MNASYRNDGKRILQVAQSPYAAEVDLAGLDHHPRSAAVLDPVSVADVLRNAFVYPPHSIYRDVKLSTYGFDPGQDMSGAPDFRFEYGGMPPAETADDPGCDYVDAYHRRLCDAVDRVSVSMRRPWMLQSGGKDSTSLAIAMAERRPETCCITYLGGREENEVDSARAIARQLGLRHEVLECDPGRAYDRYLALVDRMPLLTADFALLSYADLMAEIVAEGGDGIVDGLGSDVYFGAPVARRQRLLMLLARHLRLPRLLFTAPLAGSSFKLCFALGTLQMDAFERFFPGSRFSDAEVDELLGRAIAAQSRARLELFRAEIGRMPTVHARRVLSIVISESAEAFAKGLYTAHAAGLRMAYPFCDKTLRDWVARGIPASLRVDRRTGANKVLVRQHIARHFGALPYVAGKGSFRFDLCGLAAARYEQVHAFAQQTRAVVPGAVAWLERHRKWLDNKYHASRFYLLAVTLPWLHSRMVGQAASPRRRQA